MRLQTINEMAAANDRKKAVKKLQKLIDQGKKLARSELVGVCDDPVGMYNHAIKGMKQTKFFLFEDHTWWGTMFTYWTHIPDDILKKFYTEIGNEVHDTLRGAIDDGVVLDESFKGATVGALSILGAIAGLIFMVMFGPMLDKSYKDKNNKNKKRRTKSDPWDEQPSPKTPPGPADIGDGPDFSFPQLNPYVVFKFVERCMEYTKGEIANGNLDELEFGMFDQDERPIDTQSTGDEEIPSSGEEIDQSILGYDDYDVPNDPWY